MRENTTHQVVLCLGLAVALGGCGAVAPEAATPEGGEHDCLGGVDVSDRCSVLGEACLAGFDGSDDGCPDPYPPEVRFPPASSQLSEDATRVLNDVCIDGRRLWPGASIRLVAVSPELGAARIAEVRARLVACGVAEALLREGGDLPASPWDTSTEDAHEYSPTSVVVFAEDCAL